VVEALGLESPEDFESLELESELESPLLFDSLEESEPPLAAAPFFFLP
jgi:hypothetical protein